MCCGFLAAPGRPYAGSLSGRKPNQGQSPPRPSHSLSLHCPLLEFRDQGLPIILLQALFCSLGTGQVPKDSSPRGLKLPFQDPVSALLPLCPSIPPITDPAVPVLLIRKLGFGIIKDPAEGLRLGLTPEPIWFHLVGTSSVKVLPIFSVAQLPCGGSLGRKGQERGVVLPRNHAQVAQVTFFRTQVSHPSSCKEV